MSSTSQRGQSRDADLGKKVHNDTKTRQAQANGNSEDSIEVNITKFAATYHGIEKGQLLQVEVREGGIVIKPFPTSRDDA